MGKMTRNRNNAQARRAHAATPRSAVSEPPSQLEGDGLLAWLRESAPDRIPTEAELAAVELRGIDCIADVLYHRHLLYEDALYTVGVEDIRAYFQREAPAAVLSDDGARLNGLHRERAEREHTPLARWDMGRTFAP